MEKIKLANPEGIGNLSVRYRPNSNRGWIVTNVGNRKRERTGIPWPEDDGSRKDKHGFTDAQRRAIAKAMPLLKQRALEWEHPEIRQVTAEPKKIITLEQAIAEFNAAKDIKEKRADIQSRYRNAVYHFLLQPPHYGDIPLQTDLLRNRILELKPKCALAASTREKVMYRLNEYCEYWYQCQYIERNPLSQIGIPKDDADDDAEPMPPDLFKQYHSWLIENGFATVADFIQIVYAMGLRPSEALKMRWEDYHGTTFKVHGKSVRGNKSGIRHFALFNSSGEEIAVGIPSILPPLTQILETIKSRAGNGDGYLFPWRSLSKVQPTITACRKALKADPKYTLRSLRTGAVLTFRDVYKWGISFRCLQLGHSEAVHIKHYERKRRKAEEIVAAADTPHI